MFLMYLQTPRRRRRTTCRSNPLRGIYFPQKTVDGWKLLGFSTVNSLNNGLLQAYCTDFLFFTSRPFPFSSFIWSSRKPMWPYTASISFLSRSIISFWLAMVLSSMILGCKALHGKLPIALIPWEGWRKHCHRNQRCRKHNLQSLRTRRYMRHS